MATRKINRKSNKPNKRFRKTRSKPQRGGIYIISGKDKKLFEAVDNIEEVIPEITDIDDEEYDELVAYVREKWDYDEENLEWIVDTAIEAGRSILTLVSMSDKKA